MKADIWKIKIEITTFAVGYLGHFVWLCDRITQDCDKTDVSLSLCSPGSAVTQNYPDGPSTPHNTRENSGGLSDPFDQTHIGHIPAHCVGAANLTFE